MESRAFFVAATGQNVGKTTICLGLVAALKKKMKSVGFMKPVGQEQYETETGLHVDKDVVLFKNHFKIKDHYEDMSPVLFPRGFTRDYLDGKIDHEGMTQKISRAFQNLKERNDLTVIEGTGHTGVGSIVNLNNAQVAALLGVKTILIASGGLGSSLDDLALNITMCQKFSVPVAGVILNRVLEEKREMVLNYMTKALARWEIPLLGFIPFNSFLSVPSMQDFEALFQTKLLTGEEHRMRHFHHIRLVATSIELYRALLVPNQLMITPASREDIILATLTRYWDAKIAHPEEDLETGMILIGKTPPKESIIEQIRRAGIPMLYAPLSSFLAMKMINSYVAKIRKEDHPKVEAAINLVERYVDLDLLLKLI